MLRMKSYDMRKSEAGSVLLMVAGGMVMLLAVAQLPSTWPTSIWRARRRSGRRMPRPLPAPRPL